MKLVLALFGVFIFSVSCTDSDDENITDKSLAGEWVLPNVYCYCYFDETTDFSTHKLVFDSIENKVTVINDSVSYFFHEAGQFSYSNQDNLIRLEDSSYSYTYQIDGAILTLIAVDDPLIADDEVTLVYRKL